MTHLRPLRRDPAQAFEPGPHICERAVMSPQSEVIRAIVMEGNPYLLRGL